MGIFDGIFNNGPQDQARSDQVSGLTNAFSDASHQIDLAQTNTNKDFAAGLTPYMTNLGVDQAGQNSYANATGVNGQAGYDQAVKDFHTGPGYQFALDQGNQNVLRNASATGSLASGGTLTALDQYGQGLADQQWQQYVQNLLPFIGASTQNAAGAAGVNTAKAGVDAGYGGNLASMAWAKDTGIGNAEANAELAHTGENANALDFGMNAAKSLVGFL